MARRLGPGWPRSTVMDGPFVAVAAFTDTVWQEGDVRRFGQLVDRVMMVDLTEEVEVPLYLVVSLIAGAARGGCTLSIRHVLPSGLARDLPPGPLTFEHESAYQGTVLTVSFASS